MYNAFNIMHKSLNLLRLLLFDKNNMIIIIDLW